MSRPRDLSDDEEEYAQPKARPRKGGYDSRVEQILYENEDLQILITDAGKNHESGGSYIAYTIRTGVNPSSGKGNNFKLTVYRISKFAGDILSLRL